MNPRAGTSLSDAIESYAPLAVLALLAVFTLPLFTGPAEINGDTAWLLTLAERMLAGERPYIDFIETNPPMSILLYVPAAWLSARTGVSGEALIYVQTFVTAAISAALSLHIARRHLGLGPLALLVFAAALAAAFLTVPSRSFTQREHLALMLVFPAVLTLAARAERRELPTTLALVCGVLAGFGACIKPHFALAVALPAAAAAWRSRRLRTLFAPEALAAGGVFAAYLAVCAVFFRVYLDVPLFLAANSYLLYTYSFSDYFSEPPALVFLLIIAVWVLCLTAIRSDAALVTVAMALLAFAAAFVLQGKGFAYHLYPVAALLLILACLISGRGASMSPVAGLAVLVLAATLAALSARYSSQYPATAELRRAITALKPRASLIVFTFDIAVGFPLVRQTGGVWASRLCSTWISNSAGHALRKGLDPAQEARTRRAIEMERDWLAEDVARNRPDVLVFDEAFMLTHLRGGAAFRAAFDGWYAPAGTAENGRFLLFRRIAAVG